MIGVIYVEQAVRDHPRTEQVLARFPRAQTIPCRRYGEVFNRSGQSFRLQKRRPALILAEKHDGHVLPAPPGYGIGGLRNFYFAHMLNCLYDCRYCFLQGMYRSAHWVLFVNYEAYQRRIDATLREEGNGEETWFFSGYDCDSLAFEQVSGFVEHFLPFFAERPRAMLELRTKSVAVETLLASAPLDNVVVAFSLSPREVAEALEHRAPSLERRLRALERLHSAGWRLGLRFDPLIDFEGCLDAYRRLFEEVLRRLPPASLHSVSLGNFRLPRPFHRRLLKLYPEEPFLAAPMEERDGLVSYRQERAEALFRGAEKLLLQRLPEELYFPCLSG